MFGRLSRVGIRSRRLGDEIELPSGHHAQDHPACGEISSRHALDVLRSDRFRIAELDQIVKRITKKSGLLRALGSRLGRLGPGNRPYDLVASSVPARSVAAAPESDRDDAIDELLDDSE